MIPDATELVVEYLKNENDSRFGFSPQKKLTFSAKRNALLMLINTDLASAVVYYTKHAASIPTMDLTLQLMFIEMIRKDARNANADRAKYIQTVISLLGSSTSAVRYEAANTLVFLSSHRSAIQAAIATYIDLAIKESDNNVKLIVLNRIDELIKNHALDGIVMDILRILSSPDLLVRKRGISFFF